jgi:uncharacterized protein YbaP (TraB family)
MRRLTWPLLFCLALSAAWSCLAGADGDAEKDNAIFWSLARDGENAGYLLGTIHSEDPRVLDFPDHFIARLAGSDTYAMELVPDLPTLTRLTEYMHYQDGSTLESRIGAERFARLSEALENYRVPRDWVARMKVWAAMMTLSVPPPQSGLFMDFSLSLRAAGAGLEVVGLETLEQQLSFLENMPMKQQLALLDHALADYERVGELHEQLVDSYLAGDLGRLTREAEEQMGSLDPQARAYFMEEGIDTRNRRMAEAALALLGKGRVFIAVGALHLPGEQGLIALLRASGYDLEPLPLPFAKAENGHQADNRGAREKGDTP